MKKTIIIIGVFALLAGCQSNQTAKQDNPNNENLQETILTEDKNDQQSTGNISEPQGQFAESQQDGMQSMGNGQSCIGKVVATRYADLSFQSSLPILRIMVKNGQQVRQGQHIAELDMFRLNNTIEQQRKQIEQAELQMKDVIIAQGYDPDKPSNIPAEVKKTAEVKSGYSLAKSQLEAAENELKTAVLTAPFNGIVANVKAQAHEISQPGQAVCRIISTDDMAVEFRVMEADLANYPIGTGITVIPVAYKDRQYKATVSEINPIVDEQSAIVIRARLTQAQDLFVGMNCEIVNIGR